MSTLTAGVQARSIPVCAHDIRLTTRPRLSCVVIIVSDVAALLFTFIACIAARTLFPAHNFDSFVYLRLWPALGLFAAAYAIFGLYPGVSVSPVRELQRLTSATTLVFLILATALFITRGAETYSRTIFFASWLAALVVVPLFRSLVRQVQSSRSWWGYPVLIYGTGEASVHIAHQLQRNPERGLHPIAYLSNDQESPDLIGLPVLSGFDGARDLVGMGVHHVILPVSEFSQRQLTSVVREYSNYFPDLFVVPDLPALGSLCLESRDICRMLMLQLRNRLLYPVPQLFKRLIDVVAGGLMSVCLAPLMLLIVILIKLDSSGPAFYSQARIGHNGRRFRVWKFRTMVSEADIALQRYLSSNAAATLEWAANQKLRHDPRITRMGTLLRKTSLDELPQLWNVLRGDMSLVGPRPIIESEVLKYGNSFELYTKVVPGVTGIWQVSGRSNTTYEERVELDTYYVRNWSPWLDLYLLARTIGVVLRGDGAY